MKRILKTALLALLCMGVTAQQPVMGMHSNLRNLFKTIMTPAAWNWEKLSTYTLVGTGVVAFGLFCFAMFGNTKTETLWKPWQTNEVYKSLEALIEQEYEYSEFPQDLTQRIRAIIGSSNRATVIAALSHNRYSLCTQVSKSPNQALRETFKNLYSAYEQVKDITASQTTAIALFCGSRMKQEK